jgi:hypothetical protein
VSEERAATVHKEEKRSTRFTTSARVLQRQKAQSFRVIDQVLKERQMPFVKPKLH